MVQQLSKKEVKINNFPVIEFNANRVNVLFLDKKKSCLVSINVSLDLKPL